MPAQVWEECLKHFRLDRLWRDFEFGGQLNSPITI
jgi:hypothetical protein